MAQQVNMELVENMRPFIWQMINEWFTLNGSGGSGGYVAGENIVIGGSVIHLDSNVIISESIKIPDGANLLLEDPVEGRYVRLHIVRKDGIPFLMLDDSDGF